MARFRHVNLRMGNAGFVLIDDGCLNDRIINAMREQDRFADFRQEVLIIEGPREQRLSDIRRNRHTKAQHQIKLLGRKLLGEAEPQQRFKTAHAFFHIAGIEARNQAEKLRTEHRDRRVATQFRNAANEIDSADVILAVMPQVVENDEWTVRPATKNWMIQFQTLYNCIDIIGP